MNKEGPQPRSQKFLLLRPQKQAPRSSGFAHKITCTELKPARPGPQVAGGRTVLAETLL